MIPNRARDTQVVKDFLEDLADMDQVVTIYSEMDTSRYSQLCHDEMGWFACMIRPTVNLANTDSLIVRSRSLGDDCAVFRSVRKPLVLANIPDHDSFCESTLQPRVIYNSFCG